MNAIILSVGDELVLGQTVDTNSAWISQHLAAVGCDMLGHATVPDDEQAIEQAIRDAAGRCDFLIISGGIGPTEDDLTRQALAAVLRVPLELNESWLEHLRSFFKRLGREMPQANRIQAMIPRGAKIIENTAGTAAGIDAVLGPAPLSLSDLAGRPIGRVLTKMGKVTREQVVEALTIQKGSGGLLGEILVRLGYVTKVDVEAALLAQKVQLDPSRQPPPAPPAPPQSPQSPPPQASASRASPEDMARMFGGRGGQQVTEELERFVAEMLRRMPPGRSATRVFVMPGVPKEMKIMFQRDVLAHIAQAAGGAVILSRTLHTFGLGESSIAEKLGDLMKRDRNPSVGTTVANGIVSLRINARFPSRDEAQQQLDATTNECRAALGDLIFGADDDTLPKVLAASLASSRKTVTTAESCTGGLLAKMLTDISGSSDYFKQGWVTYSNEAKRERLGVSENFLNVYGAVSEAVVEAMARAARRLAKSDYALAISGIAGPSGGTEQKPVGTVCIALVGKDEGGRMKDVANSDSSFIPHPSSLLVRTFHFTGDREMIRDRSAKMALTMLRFHLIDKPMPF